MCLVGKITTITFINNLIKVDICIINLDVEMVGADRYLGVHFNNKLDTGVLCKKGQSHLHLLEETDVVWTVQDSRHPP